MSQLAIVTGASNGIGFGTAIQMAKAGYDIVGTYNSSAEGAAEMKKRVEATGRKCGVYQLNISKMEEIYAFWEKIRNIYETVDVLVNNAGVMGTCPFLEITQEFYERIHLTNLRGTFFMTQQGAKLMVDKGIPGVIINISSNHMKACFPNSATYATAKAGLSKLCENAGMELAEYGIRVVTIAPGYTANKNYWDTGAEKNALLKTKEWRTNVTARIPLHRFCMPEEIGDACVFLAGPGGAYITGTTIFMDGGALLPVVAQNTYTNTQSNPV